MTAFLDFFKQNEIDCDTYTIPNHFWGIIALVVFIYKNRYRNILITMPPFRKWFLVLLPKVNVIFDIRDGWSIAIRTGYGGSAASRPYRAGIALWVEKSALRFSRAFIVCTEGLETYYRDHIGDGDKNKIALIPNGYSTGSPASRIKQLRVEDQKLIKAICVGKFAEYGSKNVEMLLDYLANKYDKNDIQVTLVGADHEQNSWTHDYIAQKKYEPRIQIKFLDRVSTEKLLHMIRESDMGIALVRDPAYEYGTKAFDYISQGIPIVNYFEEPNLYTGYFAGFFVNDELPNPPIEEHSRRRILSRNRRIILDFLK